MDLFLLLYLFICILFLAVLGLRFCARAFSSCGERGPLFIAVRGPLTIAGCLVAEHRLQSRRLSSCGSWAQLLRGMWDLPRSGLEPVSPALAGRFSTTAPPGKRLSYLNLCSLLLFVTIITKRMSSIAIDVHNGLPQGTLPLCLNVKLKCLCSAHRETF